LLDLIAQQPTKKLLLDVKFIVCEDLELVDETYELGLSLLLHTTQANPIRIIGLAAALGDAEALSDWLGVPTEGIYCFPPTERDQALSVTFQTFTIPCSAALVKAMTKPVYDSIRTLSINESAIIFVPSASQCKRVVADLVTQCVLTMNLRGFLGEDVSQDMLEGQASFLKNEELQYGVMRGFGVWHDRMHQADRILMLRLFVEGIIRVIVIPREMCWNAPVRAGLVIVMGTQYAAGGYPGHDYPTNYSGHGKPIKTSGHDKPIKTSGHGKPIKTSGHDIPIKHSGHGTATKYSEHDNPIKQAERRIVEYSLHELVRMQGRAVRHGKTGRFHILCQAEQRETYMRFLTDGLPLESQLLGQDDSEDVGSGVLKKWLKNQRISGTMNSRQDVMDFLSSTLLIRRMEKNPSYYDVTGDRVVFLSRIVDSLWDQTTPEQEVSP
jgi:antiviral helicase SLH1